MTAAPNLDKSSSTKKDVDPSLDGAIQYDGLYLVSCDGLGGNRVRVFYATLVAGNAAAAHSKNTCRWKNCGYIQ